MTTHFAANAVVNLVNVLFFVVVQTIFFVLVASRELDRVVREKSSILLTLREQLGHNCVERGVSALDWRIHEVDADVRRRNPEALKAERWQANRGLLLRWVGPVVLALVVGLAALIGFLVVRKHAFPVSHRVGLGLVVVAYIVEILIFLFVIERYTMVGDNQLLEMLLGLSH